MAEGTFQLLLTVFGHPGQRSLTFHPGQEVSGTLELTADKEVSVLDPHPLLLLGIQAQLTGYAAIETKELVSGISKEYIRDSERETYVDLKVMLLGDLTTPTKISAGVTELPFKFQLPAITLPCSYVRPDAKVEYVVDVDIKKLPGAPGDDYVKATQKIEMDTPYPLTPDKQKPSNASSSTLIASGCCTTYNIEPLELTVRTDKGGYDVAGDVIELEVKVDNKTGRKVKNVTAELVGVSYFGVKADGDMQTTEFPEEKKRWGKGVSARSTGVWKVVMPLPKPQPKLRPTQLGGGCSLISLNWQIRVVAELRMGMCGKNKNLTVNCPILLGTSAARMKDYPSLKQ